jgi:hypothetical protein
LQAAHCGAAAFSVLSRLSYPLSEDWKAPSFVCLLLARAARSSPLAAPPILSASAGNFAGRENGTVRLAF